MVEIDKEGYGREGSSEEVEEGREVDKKGRRGPKISVCGGGGRKPRTGERVK